MARVGKKRSVRAAAPTPASSREGSGGFAEGQAEWRRDVPDRLDLKLGPGGRVVIPAVYRDAMQVKEGDRIMASVEDGELRLISPRMAIKKAQRMVRESIPGDDSLVDALMEYRRREVADEFGDG